MAPIADPRWNLTDPVVLSPLEILGLSKASPALAGLGSLASSIWAGTPLRLFAEPMEEVIFGYDAVRGTYTMSAPPFHTVWVHLAAVQNQLAAEVMVNAGLRDIEAYVDQYGLTLFILDDQEVARAQFVSFLLMQGVSQRRSDNNLVNDVTAKVIERYRARARTSS